MWFGHDLSDDVRDFGRYNKVFGEYFKDARAGPHTVKPAPSSTPRLKWMRSSTSEASLTCRFTAKATTAMT